MKAPLRILAAFITNLRVNGEVNETLPEKRVANKNIHCATIIVPLGNLESVGAYAFKSRAIATFTPVEDRRKQYICYGLAGAMNSSYISSELDEGGFYCI